MTFFEEWELMKKHVADLVQVEVEAAMAVHLTIQIETFVMLQRRGVIGSDDISMMLAKLDFLTGTLKENPQMAHFMSLSALQLRNALEQQNRPPS